MSMRLRCRLMVTVEPLQGPSTLVAERHSRSPIAFLKSCNTSSVLRGSLRLNALLPAASRSFASSPSSCLVKSPLTLVTSPTICEKPSLIKQCSLQLEVAGRASYLQIKRTFGCPNICMRQPRSDPSPLIFHRNECIASMQELWQT